MAPARIAQAQPLAFWSSRSPQGSISTILDRFVLRAVTGLMTISK